MSDTSPPAREPTSPPVPLTSFIGRLAGQGIKPTAYHDGARPMTTENLPEHVQRNRAEWDNWAVDWADRGARDWASEAITWGTLKIPEAAIHILPDDLAGLDVIELGCGTAY